MTDITQVKKHMDYLKKLPLSRALPLMQGYLKELKIEMAKRTLIIESTVAMSAAQLEQIKKSLSVRFPISEVKTIINPSLLGGVKVKVGDMVYNDSLAMKINNLKGVYKL